MSECVCVCVRVRVRVCVCTCAYVRMLYALDLCCPTMYTFKECVSASTFGSGKNTTVKAAQFCAPQSVP